MRYAVPVLLLTALSIFGDDRSVKAPPSLVERLERTLGGDDKPFALVTQVYIRPGAEVKFEAAAAKAAKASMAEKGCLAYDFNGDLEKPGHYTLIERWTGLAPLRKHLTMEHTRQIQGVFGELSTTPRTSDIFAPVGAK
jgi:quinol monooxygenase YgiN